MAFCEPKFPDHGAVSCGWRGHGGILFDESGRLLPQYNLEAAWKRRITPISGFDEGLLLPRAEKPSLLRPPGHLRFDQPHHTMMHRNLICAKGESEAVNFWVVSERSQRNILEEYKAKVSAKGDDAAEWRLKSDEWLIARTVVDDAISEIRSSINDKFSVLCKGRQNLFIVPLAGDTQPIFKSSVRCFEENPILSDEVSLLGNNGMVWSGLIGESLTRTKTREDDLKLLTHSDHPRVLTVGNDLEIRSLDLRDDSNSTRLFSSPPFDVHPHNDLRFTGEPLSTPAFTHICSLPQNPHSVLAITTDRIFLLDDRCPGRYIISNKHAIPNGPNVLIPAKPVKDRAGDGHIQSLYFLDHFCTGIWQLNLYQHPGDTWSSIRPLHGIANPNDAVHLVAPISKEGTMEVFQPTRGIAILNDFSCEGKSVDILLRSYDDGAVTYRPFFYGQEEHETRIQERSLARSSRFARKLHKFNENMKASFSFDLAKSIEESCAIIDVEVSFPSPSASQGYSRNPLHKRVSKRGVVLEPLLPAHEDAFLSNVVNSQWNTIPTL